MPGALVQDEIELMLQINGKLRGSLRVPARRRQGEPSKPRRWPRSGAQAPGRQAPKKLIVVPGRLVNIVV
jgi:leucyl-tRNA synthetase